MYDCVSNLLSSCDALTPSVLKLLANIAMYLYLVRISPLSQTPVVYEPRKNSSAIRRSSTPSQSGNCPSVLRTDGSDVMPAPTFTYRLKFQLILPAPTTCAGSPCDVLADQTYR